MADQFLEEISRIEKEIGTKIREIKVGEVQISKKDLLLKEHIPKGNEFYYKKEYQKAIECYEKALEIDPKYTDAWNNKGRSLYHLRKYKEALECSEESNRDRSELWSRWDD